MTAQLMNCNGTPLLHGTTYTPATLPPSSSGEYLINGVVTFSGNFNLSNLMFNFQPVSGSPNNTRLVIAANSNVQFTNVYFRSCVGNELFGGIWAVSPSGNATITLQNCSIDGAVRGIWLSNNGNRLIANQSHFLNCKTAIRSEQSTTPVSPVQISETEFTVNAPLRGNHTVGNFVEADRVNTFEINSSPKNPNIFTMTGVQNLTYHAIQIASNTHTLGTRNYTIRGNVFNNTRIAARVVGNPSDDHFILVEDNIIQNTLTFIQSYNTIGIWISGFNANGFKNRSTMVQNNFMYRFSRQAILIENGFSQLNNDKLEIKSNFIQNPATGIELNNTDGYNNHDERITVSENQIHFTDSLIWLRHGIIYRNFDNISLVSNSNQIDFVSEGVSLSNGVRITNIGANTSFRFSSERVDASGVLLTNSFGFWISAPNASNSAIRIQNSNFYNLRRGLNVEQGETFLEAQDNQFIYNIKNDVPRFGIYLTGNIAFLIENNLLQRSPTVFDKYVVGIRIEANNYVGNINCNTFANLDNGILFLDQCINITMRNNDFINTMYGVELNGQNAEIFPQGSLFNTNDNRWLQGLFGLFTSNGADGTSVTWYVRDSFPFVPITGTSGTPSIPMQVDSITFPTNPIITCAPTPNPNAMINNNFDYSLQVFQENGTTQQLMTGSAFQTGNFITERRIRGYQSLCRLIRKSQTTDPTLINWLQTYLATHEGKFELINDLIAIGSYQTAYSLNQSIPTGQLSLIFKNQKEVNRIYLRSVLGFPVTNGHLNQLRQIANQCPITGGHAVYDARIFLYDYDSLMIDDYPDVCSTEQQVTYPRISANQDTQKTVSLYPNPSTGTLSIQGVSNGQAYRIFNPIGQIVKQGT
ncbi:MAG: hypothetical protein NZ108_01570, partial [Bacteroidia bacterium]|nr:hypothetical protein [Bacteroidia bacterium]